MQNIKLFIQDLHRTWRKESSLDNRLVSIVMLEGYKIKIGNLSTSQNSCIMFGESEKNTRLELPTFVRLLPKKCHEKKLWFSNPLMKSATP